MTTKKLIRYIRNLSLTSLALLAMVFLYGPKKLALQVSSYIVKSSTSEQVLQQQDINTIEKRDYAIVLGTSIRSEFFQHRVNTAAKLFHSRKVPKLYLTGDGREANYHEPKAMYKMLLQQGVPADAMELDTKGLCTSMSIQNFKSSHSESNCYIVTQGYHAYRALFHANHLELDARAFCATSPENMGDNLNREKYARVKAVLESVGLSDFADGLAEKHQHKKLAQMKTLDYLTL